MPEEFLPPVVTKLEGDISNLLEKLAEAKAAMETFNRNVEEQAKKSGKQAGEGLGDEMAKGVKKRAAMSAEELLATFKQTTSTAHFKDADMQNFAEDIRAAFKKAGAKGGTDLFAEFTKTLRGGIGLDNEIGRSVVASFEEFGQKGGMQAGDAFKGGFLSMLGDMGTAAVPVVGPAIAVLVAEILADVGGAALTVAGGGALTAAIITQLKDPAVHEAAADLGGFLKQEWTDATSVIDDRLIAGFDGLKDDLLPVLGDMKVGFQALAPDVQLFAEELGKAARDFAPGFGRAMQQAEPVLAVFIRDLPTLFNGFNIFFDEISKGAKGGAEGIDTLIKALALLLAGLGFVIRVSENFFDGYVRFADMVTGFMAKIPGFSEVFGPLHKYVDGIAHSWDNAKKSLDDLAPAEHKVTSEADRQKAAIDKLTGAWDKWFGVSMTVDQANLTLHQNMTALTESIAQNGRQWDLNTKSGQANYGALLQAIQAAHDYRQAEIDSGVSAAQANREYQTSVDKLLGIASSSGLSAGQVQNLKNQVYGLIWNLDQVPSDLYIRTHFITEGTPPSQFYHGLSKGGVVGPGGVIRAAQGLLPPRAPGTLVLAGEPETGGEVMIPQRGISRARAAALGSVAMAPYGLAVAPAAPAGGMAGGGGGTLPPIVVQFVVDGRVFHTQVVMPAAQQHKKVYGSTGLG